MDPDVGLQLLRAAVTRIDAVDADPEGSWGGELSEVLERFAALDEWMSRGGFLPADWSANPSPVPR